MVFTAKHTDRQKSRKTQTAMEKAGESREKGDIYIYIYIYSTESWGEDIRHKKREIVRGIKSKDDDIKKKEMEIERNRKRDG